MDAHIASLPNGGQSAIGTQWGAGDIMYKDLNGDGKISTGANTLNDHGDLKRYCRIFALRNGPHLISEMT